MREQRVELEFSPNLRGRLLVVWSDRLSLNVKCGVCGRWVKPEKLQVGPHHVRMTHCGQSQEVAVTA